MKSILHSETNSGDTRTQQDGVRALTEDEVRWRRVRARMAIMVRVLKRWGKGVGGMHMLTRSLEVSSARREVDGAGRNR